MKSETKAAAKRIALQRELRVVVVVRVAFKNRSPA